MNDKPSPIIADGQTRLYNALLLEVQASINEKYRAQWACARWWQRIIIRWTIRLEIRKTMRHQMPKDSL